MVNTRGLTVPELYFLKFRRSRMICIGIDPGLTGGIVALDSETNQLELFKIPRLGKNDLNGPVLLEILKKYQHAQHILAIEDVHSIFGSSAAANFTFGKVAGMLEGVVVGAELSFTKVQPKAWQKVAWLGVPPLFKNAKKDTKAMSYMAATRLFPKQKFLKTKDGIIDAALIAFYLKVTYARAEILTTVL
jgi:crossover junction endodeoxyribonuclease RuvC